MNGKIILQKLRIKPGQRVMVLHAPPEFRKLLQPLPEGVTFGEEVSESCDVILCFVRSKAELDRYLPAILQDTSPASRLWVSFPKKSSNIQTDLTRDTGWDILGRLGFRPVSLISVDDVWSAMALRPVELVKRARGRTDTSSAESKYVDRAKRTILPPPDLRDALKANTRAAGVFGDLSYSNKREFVLWILDAKRPETRKKRVKEAIAKLKSGLRNPSEKPRE